MADPQSLFTDPFAPSGAEQGMRPFETGATAPAPTSLFTDPYEESPIASRSRVGADTAPDEAARVLRLQMRTGLPAPVIQRNLDQVEREATARDFDVERFRRDSPLLAEWLKSDEYHAALAKDDIEPLTAIEQVLTVGRNLAGAAGAGVMRFSRGMWGMVQAGAEVVGAEKVASFAEGSGAVAESLADWSRGAQPGTGFVGRNIYGGVESVGQMAPSMALGLVFGPGAMLGTVGAVTGGQSYADARQQRVGVGKALTFGAIQGGVEVATELIPAHRLLGDLAAHAGLMKTLARQIAPELGGEELATALQDLNEWAMLPSNRDATVGDYLRERPSAAAATAISTITSIGATTAAAHAGARVLDALSGAARESKTVTRAPEKARELVDSMTAGTELSAVHVPIDTFTQYFQEKGIDPAAMAERLTGDRGAYAASLQSGADLAVPMSRYVTDVAASEHQAFFRDEARLMPDALNEREARALDREMAGLVEEPSPLPLPGEDSVRASLVAQFVDAGMTPATAGGYAALYDAAFATIARRAGVDPQALYDRYGLTVQSVRRADADRAAGEVFDQGERGRIVFSPDGKALIQLFENRNASTAIHEGAHLFLRAMQDVSAESDAFTGDLATLKTWFGAETIDTPQHEQFARGFEAYVREGRAPSPELRPVFARFKAWLVGVYRSLRGLNVELNDDVRAVFDRLLASDEAIAAARLDERATPLLTKELADAAGLTEDERAAYAATFDAAVEQARDSLQGRLVGELQRERTDWWKEERAGVRPTVAADVAARPEYRALAFLQSGAFPDGTTLPAGQTSKLSKSALVEQFGEGVIERLPKGTYIVRDGLAPNVAADLLGFPSATAMVVSLTQLRPINDVIETATDARMRAEHGDVLLDGNLIDHAQQAILDAGSEVFAAELKALAAAATRIPGAPRVRPPDVATLRAIAERRVASMRVGDLHPGQFAASARRAGEQALEAAGRQRFAAALAAKQRQILSAELFRAATAARETVNNAIAGFQPLFGRDPSMAPRYNMDLVNAARAVLASFGLGPKAQTAAAHTYLDQVRRYDPETYADLDAAIEAAAQPGRPYRELSLNEFLTLRDAVHNLAHTARRSRQMVIDGHAHELDEVRAALESRLHVAATPDGRRGYDRKVTEWEKAKLYLTGLRASLRRVESWVDAVDGGDPRGVFRRMLFTPVSEAATTYRVAKAESVGKYLHIVKGIESSLTTRDIAAPELGYTFSGKIELLHALLHTGNLSNFSKLLRGRNWGHEQADGSLDTARWDAFLQRMWREGTLAKADHDYVQATWDLLEELKPDAQRAHHDMYGYFFAEISAQPVQTPFGPYRGGYFPAIVDPYIADDAAQRADRDALDGTPNSFMFPTTGRGFTKARVEPYAQPLMLDLRLVPGHIDKVLRFTHLEPRVKDAARLVTNNGFRRAVGLLDPAVAGELLVPWLQRAAKQTVDTPAQGWGGRGADRFWRALRRNTGLNTLGGNVVNALQQVTGFSLAAVTVPPGALARAFVGYVRNPGAVSADVADKSAFMRTRSQTQVIEVQRQIDDVLLNPSKFEQLRAFTAKHGYVLAEILQNVVDVVAWSGSYDHALSEGVAEHEAVRRADAAVRQTQGSFNPEDLSSFETGTPFQRAFSMFYSYQNMKANLLGTEYVKATRDLGLRAGAGRLLYVFTMGHLVESVVGAALVDVLMKRLPGQGDDEDESLAGWLSWFFGNQVRSISSLVPGGQAATALYNTFATERRYDDKISASPAIQAVENSVRAPSEVYEAIVHGKRQKEAIRDTLTLLGLLTGTPAAALGRPLGYLADDGAESTGPVDAARGLVVGR